MFRVGVGGYLCKNATAITKRAVGTLGRVGEVVYEVGYVRVLFSGDYVFEVGS